MSAVMEATEPTLEALSKLSIGDLVESVPLMAGLSSELVTLMVVGTTKSIVSFKVEYYGVLIATAELKTTKGGHSWKLFPV